MKRRKSSTDELAQTQEDSSAVSHILTQIQHSASPGECLESREGFFTIRRQRTALKHPTFPAKL